LFFHAHRRGFLKVCFLFSGGKMRLQEHVATNIDFQIFVRNNLTEEGPWWKSQNFKIFASSWRIFMYENRLRALLARRVGDSAYR
jgi:hypothetical protein